MLHLCQRDNKNQARVHILTYVHVCLGCNYYQHTLLEHRAYTRVYIASSNGYIGSFLHSFSYPVFLHSQLRERCTFTERPLATYDVGNK